MLTIARAFGRALLPADTSLPKRHWRHLWLAAAFRLFVIFPFTAVMTIPYLLCSALVLGMDYLGTCVAGYYATCHNRDLWRSGWKVPQQRVPAPELSEEQKARA